MKSTTIKVSTDTLWNLKRISLKISGERDKQIISLDNTLRILMDFYERNNKKC